MSEAMEDLEQWEKMMACCFPCGFVWMKEGCGSACCLNYVLGALFGVCCINICHACQYVGEQGKPGSPYETIKANQGNGGGVVIMQPGVQQPQQYK